MYNNGFHYDIFIHADNFLLYSPIVLFCSPHSCFLFPNQSPSTSVCMTKWVSATYRSMGTYSGYSTEEKVSPFPRVGPPGPTLHLLFDKVSHKA